MKEKFKIKNCDRSKYIFLKACSNLLKVTLIITFIYMYILNMIWYFQNHALHNFLKNLHKGLVIVTKVAHSLRLCHDTDPSLRSYINMAILYFHHVPQSDYFFLFRSTLPPFSSSMLIVFTAFLKISF